MAPSSARKGNQPISSRIKQPKVDSKMMKKKKHTKTKSPGVRIINGRIYDSENGKTCHQCGQKTMTFSVKCKNYNENKQCGTHFCQICLLKRYGENVEDAVALDCEWKCPICRGICNCSRCMRKRGCKPTGILFPIAKAKGFSSVSDMLRLEDWRSIKAEEEDASFEKDVAINEEPVAASSKRARTKTILDKNHDTVYQSKPSKMRGSSTRSLSKMSTGRIADNSERSKEAYGALKDTKDCDEQKFCKYINQIPRNSEGSSSKMPTGRIADNPDNMEESKKEHGALKDTKDSDEHKVCKRMKPISRNSKGSSPKMPTGRIADNPDNIEESKKEHGTLKDTIDCNKQKVKRIKQKSPGVRIIKGKIYDSENGKTCHQCRQKTTTFAVRCKNYRRKEQCSVHFCQICLLNRYGENAEEIAKSDFPWKCPKCRGVCNCSFCMKTKGCKPTGRLHHIAKANGFRSVLEMLGSDTKMLDDSSPKGSADSNEDLNAASSRKARKKTNFEGNHDAGYQCKPSKNRESCEVPSIIMSSGRSSVSAETRKKCKKRDSEPKEGTDCDKEKVRKPIKRTKSPGIRIISGRVYDSENGKTCHQCRQKTLIFTVTCKNYNRNKQCGLYFCQICLLNRYGEIAVEISALGCEWMCPKCRGVCNCCRCMKKRGYKPTGILYPTAKAKGFPSVSEMLSLEDCRKVEVLEGASLKRCSYSNEVGKSKFVDSDETRIKVEITEETRADERVEYTQLHATDNFSTELIVAAKSDEEDLSQELLRWPTIKHVITRCENGHNPTKHETVEDVTMNAESTMEFQINKEVQTVLPLGHQLTKIANLELPAEDIGNALQILEFCHTFGEVLHMRKEQSESLLQEIVSGQISGDRCDFSSDYFHIKLLSIIQRDSGKGCLLEAEGRNSWIEALGKYMSDSEIMSKEFMLDSESWGLDSYEKQSPSKKLRILTFLCDDALGTSELRNWIDQQILKFVEEAKKIKIAKKKLQDEMANEILQSTRKQLLMSEHQSLDLKIKAEVIQCLNDKLDEMKKGMRNAVRLDPLLSDRDGRKFWKLRSYSGEMDVLLQDVVTHAGSRSCKENWFGYNAQEKATVDKYIAGYDCRNAGQCSSLLCPVLSVDEN